jgi:hypothetical protein
MKNKSYIILMLHFLLLLGLIRGVYAQTDIYAQENRMDVVNDFVYKIKIEKLKSELAKITKECQTNNGCLKNVVTTITNQQQIINKKNDEQKQKNSIIKIAEQRANTIKILNTLSINAIINKKIVFDKIDGNFQMGDILPSGIKIKNIKQSSVTLSTKYNIEKTLTMDWVVD